MFYLIREQLEKYNLQYDKRMWNRYEKFIERFTNWEIEEYYEKHHILPKSLFPHVENEPWNHVKLNARAHFLCHWMLAKCFGNEMWMAFNMMLRILDNKKKSILYEYARLYIKNQCSKRNKGRKLTRKQIEALRKATRNTVMVVDKNDIHRRIFRVNKNHPDYKSGKLISYRVGFKHKDETIERMRNNSGIKDKSQYHNDNGHIIYLNKNEHIPDGYNKGLPITMRRKMAQHFSNTIWVTNILTNETKRVNSSFEITDEYVIGRRYEGLTSHLNDPNKTRILDLKIKKIILIDKTRPLQRHEVNYGTFGKRGLASVWIIRHNGYLIVGRPNLSQYLKENNFNFTVFAGKQLQKNGFEITTLDKFTYNEELIWRSTIQS